MEGIKEFKQLHYEKESDHIESLVFTRADDECDHDTTVQFDIIERVPTSELTMEDSKYLGNVGRDIRDACRATNIKNIYVIKKWTDSTFDECLDIVEDDMLLSLEKSDEETAIFLMVNKDNPLAWQHIGTAASKGYMTADHLVDIYNTITVVKTSMNNYRIMNKANTLLTTEQISSIDVKLYEEEKSGFREEKILPYGEEWT